MYLLDTNHAGGIIRGYPPLGDRYAQVGKENIAIPFVVCGEPFYMAEKSERKTENLGTVYEFLRDVRVVHSDLGTCAIYAELKRALLKHFGPRETRRRFSVTLHQIGVDDNDLWIAASAIRHSLTLVSADSDFERIRAVRELRLESWL